MERWDEKKKRKRGIGRRKEEIEGRKNEIGKGRKNGREENMNRQR